MADTVTIEVQPRDPKKNKGTGSRASSKLRDQGRVPAIIYGHKKDSITISLANEDIAMMLKKQVHLARLSWNGTSELAVVRDVQWDYLGKSIIHLDFQRVDDEEMVSAEVALELYGDPVGVSQGGRLEQSMRSITIVAKPADIPKVIIVEVSHLGLGQAIHVKDLRKGLLPEGVDTELDESMLIVHIIEKKGRKAAATSDDDEAKDEAQ